MKDQWTEDYLKYEKQTILDKISNELAEMSMNDFSNLVDKYDLGIIELDNIFWDLREKLFKERTNKDREE
jgi:uncharacterized lipoprotein YddW (UPF0748 family)